MGARRAAIVTFLVACKGASTPPPAPKEPERPPVATPEPAPAATPTPVAPAPAPTVGATKMTLAEVGLEATSLDRSVDPCVDFVQFACGGWNATQQIPADKPRWSRFIQVADKISLELKGLLEEDAKTAGNKLGDFYGACMDEAAIEKAGTTGIKPLLDKTTKVKDAKSWMAAVTELHKAGINVVWSTSGYVDAKDSTIYSTQLDTSGLGLPDRDYYVDAKFKDKLDAYRAHVSRMLALANVAKPDAAAADVIAVETELAKLTKTRVERRDPQSRYNPFDAKALAKATKSVDWKAYFKALGFTPSAKVIVSTPKFFAALDGLRKSIPAAKWSSYFTYQVLISTAFALPKAFDAEAFELQKAVTGVTEQEPRFKRCVVATRDGLGELLGKRYVDKYFPAASRQASQALVDALVKAMDDDFASLDWMTDTTKQAARDKLAKLVRMVGYPDKWRTYDYPLKRDDFVGNQLRASGAEKKRWRVRSGKPVDRDEWQRNTFEVTSYYSPAMNNTAIHAAILQPPFFGADRGVAANFGGVGMFIGHELTHGFDDQGSQYDAKGNLVNWWKPEDETKFKAKGECVAKMYDSFEVLPKQYLNGKLTLGENIADLGGVKMAFRAYRTLRTGQKPIVADGFTEDQQFFIGVGQSWCYKARKEEAQRLLAIDPHSPPNFRVYGALRNLPEFAQAFSCAQGTPMRPTESCSVW